jgi:RecA-family ATPase
VNVTVRTDAIPIEPRSDLLLSSWVERKLPQRDYLLGGVFSTTSRWMIFGETGVGKTLLGTDIAGAVAAGKELLGWKGSQRRSRVMYLDGELPAETFQERMRLVADLYGRDIPLFGYNRDALKDGDLPPLNTDKGQEWLWQEIDAVQPDAIIFDSIMSLLGGSMSDEESWEPIKSLVRLLSAFH